MITTTKGPLDEKTLRKRTIIDDDDNELAFAVEYREYGNDEVIHRSAHIVLKKLPQLLPDQGHF